MLGPVDDRHRRYWCCLYGCLIYRMLLCHYDNWNKFPALHYDLRKLTTPASSWLVVSGGTHHKHQLLKCAIHSYHLQLYHHDNLYSYPQNCCDLPLIPASRYWCYDSCRIRVLFEHDPNLYLAQSHHHDNWNRHQWFANDLPHWAPLVTIVLDQAGDRHHRHRSY